MDGEADIRKELAGLCVTGWLHAPNLAESHCLAHPHTIYPLVLVVLTPPLLPLATLRHLARLLPLPPAQLTLSRMPCHPSPVARTNPPRRVVASHPPRILPTLMHPPSCQGCLAQPVTPYYTGTGTCPSPSCRLARPATMLHEHVSTCTRPSPPPNRFPRYSNPTTRRREHIMTSFRKHKGPRYLNQVQALTLSSKFINTVAGLRRSLLACGEQ